MWIAIIIIIVVIIFLIISHLGSNNVIYRVYNEEGECVFIGNARNCGDYIELQRNCGSKERFKTKRYK